MRIPLGVPFLAAVAGWMVKNCRPLQQATVWLPNQKTRAALAKELAAQGVALLPRLRLLRAEDLDAPVADEALISPQALRATVASLSKNDAEMAQSGALVSLFLQKTSLDDAEWSATNPTHRYVQKLFGELDVTLHQNGLTNPAAATRRVLRSAADAPGPQVVVGVLDAHGAALGLLRALAARDDATFIYPDLPADPAPALASHPGAALARLMGGIGLAPAQWEVMEGAAPAAAVPVLIEAPHLLAEAGAIRVAVQQALQAGRTPVQIICPDVTLRHVLRSALRTHGLVPQAEGLAVVHAPAGQLLQHMVQAAAAPDATALSALGAVLDLSPWLDAALWRGVGATSWNGWAAKLAGLDQEDLPLAHRPQAEQDFAHLRDVLEPLAGARPLEHWIADTLAALAALSPSWAALPGAATLQRWLADMATAPAPREWSAAGWATFVTSQLGLVCLPPEQPNCEVMLTGLLEARLLHAGTVIIAGANESVWPATAANPLLGDSDAERMGLPGPRQQLRLTAAEWHLALHAAPRVYITRSVAGASGPARPSRFLGGLKTASGAAYVTAAQASGAQHMPLPHAGVFVPSEKFTAPAWSASWVEDLGQCPYRALGKRRLQLAEAQAYRADPTAEHHGLWVHRWLDGFWHHWNGALTEAKRAEAESLLLQLGRAELERQPEIIVHLWQARLPAMARQMVDQWLRDAADGRRVAGAEAQLSAPLGSTTLKARADRVDDSAGGWWLVDYKTGTPPSWSKVASGEKPQLLVEGWLAQRMGKAVAGVQYVQVRGHGAQLVRSFSRTLAELGHAPERIGPWLQALAARYGAGKAFAAAPVFGGGLKARGHCAHCHLAGVCRWADVSPPEVRA
ncbi:MAG TPA: PD-(D/E)XK nuclease family protein [Alphaproteobacteria bacterium]|nr:PD-(D/E)XK nuclease family protein [Alphaproteobacteria bacterium]